MVKQQNPLCKLPPPPKNPRIKNVQGTRTRTHTHTKAQIYTAQTQQILFLCIPVLSFFCPFLLLWFPFSSLSWGPGKYKKATKLLPYSLPSQSDSLTSGALGFGPSTKKETDAGLQRAAGVRRAHTGLWRPTRRGSGAAAGESPHQRLAALGGVVLRSQHR